MLFCDITRYHTGWTREDRLFPSIFSSQPCELIACAIPHWCCGEMSRRFQRHKHKRLLPPMSEAGKCLLDLFALHSIAFRALLEQEAFRWVCPWFAVAPRCFPESLSHGWFGHPGPRVWNVCHLGISRILESKPKKEVGLNRSQWIWKFLLNP